MTEILGVEVSKPTAVGLFITCADMTDHSSAATSDVMSELLTEISEFRGGVLYANGRRPRFRDSSGRYRDSQVLDRHSFHILLRENEDRSLVGCIRLTACDHAGRGQVESTFGEQRTAHLIDNLGLLRSDILEGGRLIIASQYQGRGLGVLLLEAGTALGKQLGRRLIWGIVGTKDDQVNVFLQAGYKIEAGFECTSQTYDDRLVLVTIDPQDTPAKPLFNDRILRERGISVNEIVMQPIAGRANTVQIGHST
jgi:GNAT superfamily N-acetyltransferase